MSATEEPGGLQEVVEALVASYRADARLAGAITFGMNAVVVSGVEHRLQAGARGRATVAF